MDKKTEAWWRKKLARSRAIGKRGELLSELVELEQRAKAAGLLACEEACRVARKILEEAGEK